MREKIIYYLRRLPFYFIGINLIGIMVILIERADTIGSGGWDTVNINLTHLTGITLGTASIIVNSILLVILILYRRNLKFLLVIITIFLQGLIIDFWDLIVFKDLVANSLGMEILFFTIGVIFLPLGLAFMIFSKYPTTVFDQLTFMLMDIFKTKNFGIVRMGFEVFAVVTAITVGLLAKLSLTWTGIGAVGIGTGIISIILGPMINYYLKLIGIIFKKTSLSD